MRLSSGHSPARSRARSGRQKGKVSRGRSAVIGSEPDLKGEVGAAGDAGAARLAPPRPATGVALSPRAPRRILARWRRGGGHTALTRVHTHTPARGHTLSTSALA